MADRSDDGDLDVRLEWPDDASRTRRPPVRAPEPAPEAVGQGSDRRVRLRAGEGRSVAALRDELGSLRAEVAALRDELAALRAQVDAGS